MVTRVSQPMLLNTIQSDVRKQYQDFYNSQRQAATGERVTKPSDDPAAKQALLRNHEQLDQLQMFDRNVQMARKRLGYTEATFREVTDILQRGRDLALQATNEATTKSDRDAIEQEARELLDHVAQLANERLEGEYVFSGTATDHPAAIMEQNRNGTFSFSYQGNVQEQRFEIADGQTVSFDNAIKKPDSAMRQALESLAKLVEGFNEKQQTYLLATERSAKSDIPLAQKGSGLSVSGFADQDGDNTPDTGKLEIQVSGPEGNLVQQKSFEIDPNKDVLKAPEGQGSGKDGQGPKGVVNRLDSLDHVSARLDEQGRVEVEADDGFTFKVNKDETNLMDALGLSSDAPQLQGVVKELDAAQQNLSDKTSELGGKLNRLDMAESRRRDLSDDLNKLQSDLGEVDMFKAYSELNQRQQALQGAMRSSRYLQDTTIMKYL
jgi:flagellar hook-associated protein 3 FlgL